MIQPCRQPTGIANRTRAFVYFTVAFNRIAARELTAVGTFDSPSVALAASILLAGAVLSVIIPARRAAKTDSATLLRQV